MSWRITAPGKAVVVGEYAVVDGAPAIVAAIDVGVDCTVTPAPRVIATSAVGDTRFVDAALAAAHAPPGHYAFGLHRPPALPGKPGLGGSAAATVAAVWAARHAAGHPEDRDATWALATAIHRDVQGSGSGIDVAASTYGGLLRFMPDKRPLAVDRPPGRLRLVYSGASADTGPRVARYRAWDPSARAAFVAASAACVDRFGEDPLGALRDNARLLASMAHATGIAYRTPALDRIAAHAAAVGGAAKPSGAGGGDIAVAWLPDDDAAAAFAARCAADTLPVLDAGISARGVGAG